jgi:NAD-dependent DNA ligase
MATKKTAKKSAKKRYVFRGPSPWKKWKKGQRWSLEPTAAEVAYYRKTIAAANPDISRDEVEEGAIEAAQLARIDMAPKGAGGYEDWKTTGRYLTKMRALYRKRMGRHTPTAKTRLKKKTGSKRKVGGGVKRSAAKAVQPKKLRLPKRLAGKSFCLTGTMSIPRDDMHATIVRSGGTVHSSLKKSTDYLVKGTDPGDTKLAKAKKLGTTIITEKKFWSMTPV